RQPVLHGVRPGLGTHPHADQFSLRSGGPSAADLNPRCRFGATPAKTFGLGVRCPLHDKEDTMPTPIPSPVTLISTSQASFDQAEMAATSYLARYGGRTLETYRYDLRTFFQWCSDVDLAVLEAKRAHIELW